MVALTLHALGYIHALGNIICAILHSWQYLHYMPVRTFMLDYTLHAMVDIHR